MRSAWLALAACAALGCSEYDLVRVDENEPSTVGPTHTTGPGTPYQSVDAPYDPYPGVNLGTLVPGDRVVVSEEETLTVTLLSTAANYEQAVSVNGVALFDTRVDVPGATRTIGPYPVGEELVFVDEVFDNGETWFSGPGDRNRDGQIHAAIGSDAADGMVLGFEDLALDTSGGADFDDVILLVDGPALATE